MIYRSFICLTASSANEVVVDRAGHEDRRHKFNGVECIEEIDFWYDISVRSEPIRVVTSSCFGCGFEYRQIRVGLT